ncbi:MAG TPA: hypothetical protein VHY34_10390 [Caulobacteraceae bacterium]|jgi:hypothetical protein|nr:hypothetical protein [Caulobacteraceae bacterium]
MKADFGWKSRPSAEIGALMKAAYGGEFSANDLTTLLDVAATALNQNDLGRAMVAALRLRLPALDWEGAARIARANDALAKYDPNEPRDRRGRWTTGAGTASVGAAKPRRKSRQIARPMRWPVAPRQLRPAPQRPSNSPSDGERIQAPQPLLATLQGKFDDMGPVEFAKRVYRFGDWLGREGSKLTAVERANARVEYDFLQDRLNFWLGYAYVSPDAHAKLLGGATPLYQGAINSGIVTVGGRDGGLPRSMLAAGLAAWSLGGAAPAVGGARHVVPRFEVYPGAVAEWQLLRGQLGGVIDNSQAKIVWNGGIRDQGEPFENFVGMKVPKTAQTKWGAKAIDHFQRDDYETTARVRFFNDRPGEAISVKTMNTQSVTYIKNPGKIYSRLKTYIDYLADYNKPRAEMDVDPKDIRYKTIHLAVPEYTSPVQWERLDSAVSYARGRSVSLIVTRIRE